MKRRASVRCGLLFTYAVLFDRQRIERAADGAAEAQRRRDEETGVTPVFLAIGGQRLEIEDLAQRQADVADRDRVKDVFLS